MSQCTCVRNTRAVGETFVFVQKRYTYNIYYTHVCGGVKFLLLVRRIMSFHRNDREQILNNMFEIQIQPKVSYTYIVYSFSHM